MTTLRRFFAVVVMVAAAAATPNSGDGQGLYAPATLRTFALTFHDVDWLARLRSNDALETNILADRVVDGVSYPSVGVRMRGNTSCNGCWRPRAMQTDLWQRLRQMWGRHTRWRSAARSLTTVSRAID